ncbi:ABC transporter substrate-binding protein [Subtercola endophyticus]|uniref:ABC transporter substrate-binding protein n=1 Tax=Subtercola endophyticus TaxID=2895559 RepID=UPI001E3776EC|nr:extracellular solute-binding protein [Subtercola endophyticus]UFS59939.1 extracellular solute-binding protein [Subtercola endophyticus]
MKAATAALTAASIVVLAGCASSGSSSATAGSTKLSFFSWDTQAVMQPLIDEFQKQNPDITIDFSYSPPVATYVSTLQTRLLAGTAADTFIITAENKGELVQNQSVKDLTNEPFMADSAQFNKDAYTIDGKNYGLSVASWGGGVMYNQDLLAKVGYTTPPQSWSEFLDLCSKLKAAGINPFYEPGDGVGVVLSALLGLQNKAENDKMDANIFNGTSSFEKEWTPSVKTWGELFDQGLEDRAVAGLTGTQTTDEFVKGNVAMIGTGSWNLATVKAGAPNMNVGFFAVPGTTSGDTYWAGAASPAYAINAKTPNLPQAEKWLAFLSSKTGSQLYNSGTSSITTTSTFTPVVDPSLTTMVPPVVGGSIYLPSEWWPSNQDALSVYTTSVLQQFIQGAIPADQVGVLLDQKLKELQSS